MLANYAAIMLAPRYGEPREGTGYVATFIPSPHWGPPFDFVPTLGTPKTVVVMEPLHPHVPFVVATSHAHAPPSLPFCVAPPCLLALLGAPFAHPRLPPPPPYTDFTSPCDIDCSVRGWLVMALLPPPWRAPPIAWGAAPALVEFAGTS